MKDISVFLNEQLSLGEANVNEETEIKSEKEFRDYAKNMCKEAHGDDFDEDKCKETIDKFLEDNKELVDEEKWGEIVGMWNKGFAKED